MELILKNDLPHQVKAYTAIADVLSPDVVQKTVCIIKIRCCC